MKIVKEIKLDLNVGDTLELLKSIISDEGIQGNNGKIYFAGRFDDTGGSIQNKKKLFTNPPFELRISKMSDVHTRIQISYTDNETGGSVKPGVFQFGIPAVSIIIIWLLLDPNTIMGFGIIFIVTAAIILITNKLFKKVIPVNNPEIDYIMEHLENASQKQKVF